MRPTPNIVPSRHAPAVPPLPHPSWSADPARQDASRRLSAGEFWDRLGL